MEEGADEWIVSRFRPYFDKITFFSWLREPYHSEIPVEYVPWTKYRDEISPGIGYWWHFYAHMQPDISKARTLLGYAPRYTPEETLERAVNWMRERDML